MFLAAQAHSGPNLLVIKAGASANNNNNPLFGAFVSEEVKRRKGYYGNGDW